MSYLHLPRLTFSGDFTADTATVNNDVRHYDNVRFERVFQEPSTGSALLGWWNPDGGNQFALQDCAVRQVTLPDGSSHSDPGADPVIGMIVAGPDDAGTGKMLDLDPQWQMSSELWCVEIRIYSSEREVLLSGSLTTAGFRDLQRRQTEARPVNRQPMGGGWTSTLTNLRWGDKAATSPLLSHLRATTQGDRLSVQLNMYGFYYSHADGRFGTGRIVGTIGPWFEHEPETFVGGRRLFGSRPAEFQYSNFILDSPRRMLHVDLGGSFPIEGSMGVIPSSTPRFSFGIGKRSFDDAPSDTPVLLSEGTDFTTIGPLAYTSGNADWLNGTGGVVTLALTADQVGALESNQLLLLAPDGPRFQLIAREAVGGFQIRADNLVQRLDEGQAADVRIYAFQWGKPAAGVEVQLSIQKPTQALFGPVQTGDGTASIPIPWINCPASGLTVGRAQPTDEHGRTDVRLTGNKVDNPRGYVDGQVYYVNYAASGPPADPATYPMDAIYVHVRSHYDEPENPTWDHISEVLTQFGNVYPLMSRFVADLGSPAAVRARREIMIYALTRSIDDTFYMPVTRDLSEAKRRTIVKWLRNPLPGTGAPRAMFSQPAPPPPEAAEETDFMRSVLELTRKKNGADANLDTQEGE